MLYHQKVAQALAAKRESFTHQEDTYQAELSAYRAALAQLIARYPTAAALQSAIAATGQAAGALPLATYDRMATQWRSGQPRLPFGRAFAHHEEARAWAQSVIAGVTTVAADGSQIPPWHDASIPVALVQAGLFVNPHDAARPYIKDAIVEILAPDDLAPFVEDDDDDGISAEAIVNLRRFELEAHTLTGWMRAWRPTHDEPAPLVLLDGSLIVSFALKMHPGLLTSYVMAALDLLDTSQQCQVPLIAYIDSSRAHDLVTLLRVALPDLQLPVTKRIHDALLWDDALTWGDCSWPWCSARGDVLAHYGAQQDAIAFAYLRAVADQPPARIEMPRWVAESDSFASVLDILRAELVAGNGYPYAIETADAVAVISMEDRARFFRLFQRFATDQHLPLKFSQKILSKSRRRL